MKLIKLLHEALKSEDYNNSTDSGHSFDKQSLEQQLKRYKIENYTINDDGTVDVDGSVYLYKCDLTKLPIKFGKVTGHFYCNFNKLTSLEGAPKWVGKDFYCRVNKLTSLEGAPEHVGGDFDCSFANLTSLEGAPKSVGGFFDCCDNKLTTLKGAPKSVGGDFVCTNTFITSLEGAPERVGESFHCQYNENLTTLKGIPQWIGKDAFLGPNKKVKSIDYRPAHIGGTLYRP